MVTTDAGIAGKHAQPSTSAVDKTVVKQPTKTDEVIQVEDDGQTQAEDDVVPEVDKESQGPAETVKDLEDLEESEALAADMLLDLQDVVDMTEQGLCSPENWPPKHSSQFVEEFKQEEVECAESTTEDSTVPPPPPPKSHRDNRASSTFEASQEKEILITPHGISPSRCW